MFPTDWLNTEFLGNSLLTWALSACVFALVWMGLVIVRRVLARRLGALAESTRLMPMYVAERTVRRTQGWFLFCGAIFVSSRLWQVTPAIETLILKIAVIVVLIQAGVWAAAAFARFLEIRRDQELEDNPGVVAALDVLAFVSRVAIWSVVALVVLDNVGVNVTTLVAGLGVGGIAVALAAQNILGDLFASLSIVLDKPFIVGDFLVVDDLLGSVEKVGIKTTRVRSLSGEQLIFSNNDLLNSRVRNYGRMHERRVVFSLGVTYQTSADKLKKVPVIVREAIEAQESVRFDRAHFHKYGDFALIFEIVYYVLLADYNRYMDIQQAINLAVYERFAEEEIEFAYPTQTLYLARDAA